jgi:predicted transcriptional regulator
MSASLPITSFSRRERQIMDVIWRRGRATVAEVLDQLGDPPSYSAVRAMLRILEEKGHLRHEQDGPRYVYLPTTPRDVARDSALRHLVRTFFGGSVTSAAAALLELPEEGLSEGELERLARILKQSGEEER